MRGSLKPRYSLFYEKHTPDRYVGVFFFQAALSGLQQPV